MFSRSGHSFLPLILLLAGCGRDTPKAPTGVTRVAVIPFENLSGDATLDWIGVALPQAVAWQWNPSPDTLVTLAANTQGALQSGAQRVVRGTIAKHRDGRLRIETWMETLPQTRQAEPQVIATRPDTILDAAAQVAAWIGRVPRAYATKNANAFRAYVQAQQQTDPEAVRERYRAAIEADPAFSVPYLALAEFDARRGDREAALGTLSAFRESAPQAGAAEKAQARLIEAQLNQDAGAAALSMGEAAAAAPSNVALQRSAGVALAAALRYGDAAAAYQRWLKLEPGNASAWNLLAYAKAGAKDFAGAREAVKQAKVFAPGNPDIEDSEGEVEFQAGRFAEAAAVFERIARVPVKDDAVSPVLAAAWSKAAYARLLAGEDKAASESFERALKARKLEGVAAAATRADWLFQTGHRRVAFALLQPAAAATPEDRAVLAAQSCMLHAATGNWTKARESVTGQRLNGAGIVCAFYAQPEASDTEWRTRAERLIPGAQAAALRSRILGTALALRGHPAAAIAPLREALLSSGDNSDAIVEIRVLLAKCYLTLEKWSDARDTLEPWPLPPTRQMLASPLIFPAHIALRARLEQHYEHVAEFRKWAELSKKLTAE